MKIFPDFAMMPHWGHTELMVVVAAAAAAAGVGVGGQNTNMETRKQSLLGLRYDLSTWC